MLGLSNSANVPLRHSTKRGKLMKKRRTSQSRANRESKREARLFWDIMISKLLTAGVTTCGPDKSQFGDQSNELVLCNIGESKADLIFHRSGFFVLRAESANATYRAVEKVLEERWESFDKDRVILSGVQEMEKPGFTHSYWGDRDWLVSEITKLEDAKQATIEDISRLAEITLRQSDVS